jgi:hypothetical protein
MPTLAHSIFNSNRFHSQRAILMNEQRSAQSVDPVQFLEDYFRGRTFHSEFRLQVTANQTRYVEQASFKIQLTEERSANVASSSVFAGLYSAGRSSQTIPGWVDGDYFDQIVLSNGAYFRLSDASLDIELFRLLGGLIPPRGSLMVSYSVFSNESMIHKETKLGLDRGYPPVVTPLGFLLFEAGCGMGFKDWYFAEGGREGPEKLQGYKPLDSDVAKQKAGDLLQELRTFANSAPSDHFAETCRSRAERLIIVLERMRRDF